jgi:DNA-binding transcriptional MerR regulator/methylmalonyl-CoA mutase cobalamin-binding subunit
MEHPDPQTSARHPIGVVARRTGLKPDLIRAWERRYSAVEPSRSSTRRRFYTDQDIERLLLLRDATREGRAIGQVAHLADSELRALIEEDQAAMAKVPMAKAPPPRGGVPTPPPTADSADAEASVLERCLAAVQRLDARDLEVQLERGSLVLSRVRLLEKVLVPLMHAIGELWQQGTLRPAHEHMASAVVRSFVGGMRGAYQISGAAPHLIATTPAGQRHELGALIAAATAASEGWDVTYLGADLPAEEIAAAARQKGAAAVALSITYPPDDPRLGEELKRLRRLLFPDTPLLVGGRSAEAYADIFEEIAAQWVEEIPDLRRQLAHLRNRRSGSS